MGRKPPILNKGHGDTRIEKRADQYAARLLISQDEYKAAEMICGSHAGAIAYELGVTPDVVNTWCDVYQHII